MVQGQRSMSVRRCQPESNKAPSTNSEFRHGTQRARLLRGFSASLRMTAFALVDYQPLADAR